MPSLYQVAHGGALAAVFDLGRHFSGPLYLRGVGRGHHRVGAPCRREGGRQELLDLGGDLSVCERETGMVN